MLAPFFRLAAQSTTRQRTLRRLLVVHLAALGLASVALPWLAGERAALWLGNLLLIAGIVEGALLIGWRLTQLPKSQALEFLLVSQLTPARIYLAEALVGISLLSRVTLAGLPLLVVLHARGVLVLADYPTLLLLPFLWGS